DTASSQFFVVVKDSPFLDRQYTVFGEVVSGIEVADRIVSESKPNLADPSGGRPTAYQKIAAIALSE
ncbi:MAG TPA: peptidylprolyl isomerase, partial [Thermoanaerobaculia bacterium]